jgi:hypothetical protein
MVKDGSGLENELKGFEGMQFQKWCLPAATLLSLGLHSKRCQALLFLSQHVGCI